MVVAVVVDVVMEVACVVVGMDVKFVVVVVDVVLVARRAKCNAVAKPWGWLMVGRYSW